jgi:hypothetical protein
MALVTAVEMAREAGISAKSFRAALREAGFSWHEHPYKRWAVVPDSPEHEDMRRVLSWFTLHGAMRGTVAFLSGVDLREGAGQIWKAEQ